MKKNRSGGHVGTAFFLWLAVTTEIFAASASGSGASRNCARLTRLAIRDGLINLAEVIPASDEVPAYCHVVGVVNPAVGFELRLPIDSWNGRLYFIGNIGFGGGVWDTSFAVALGYVGVSTDTGHVGDFLDASWALDNRPAEIDYGSRAVHVTATVSKMIVAAFYGKGPRYSYFDGCSNGGRQGLQEAERYPGDFDGIAAGSPALDFTGAITAANWNQQALHATIDSSIIPPEKLQMIGDAALASCDGVDGLIDGLIEDPRKCSFDPDTLRCRNGDAPDCLTAGQVRALKKIYAGPTDSSGKQLFPGVPPGAESPNLPGSWNAWLINTPDGPSFGFILQDQFLRYLAFPVDDANFDWKRLNFDRDPQRMQLMGGIINATNPDLSEFGRSGGKLLLWHGWSDPIIEAARTVDFYEDVRRTLGRAQTERLARLFLAPGVSHCGGGTGPDSFDYFTALQDWVEKGIAPDSLESAHYDADGNIDRTRPLCVYPRVARYNGHGSIDDAANFQCVEPAAGKE
ncbi:MAG TPA: tannase/feruloyl esterase family alpha/beta hydrolase [Thermoanaerobaculia bacterium]|nr:tannase/feruloyl esterase family alpha/beta hydrolase [Thermoanaerobaculia bacterium]